MTQQEQLMVVQQNSEKVLRIWWYRQLNLGAFITKDNASEKFPNLVKFN